MTLPLPESAFSNWKNFIREYNRSIRTLRLYDAQPLTDWQPYNQVFTHMQRILKPVRINQNTLTKERARQMRSEPGNDLAAEWETIAKDYAVFGFVVAAEVTLQKAQVLRHIDWEQVPRGDGCYRADILPAELQAKLDLLFENDQMIEKRSALEDIRAQFVAQPELYIIMPDDQFNTHMIDMICSSSKLRQEIENISEAGFTKEMLIGNSPNHRKGFAKAVVGANINLCREIWEYLPNEAPATTRRGLWLGEDGLLSIVETHDGTDDDLEPYLVDVSIRAWPSGVDFAAFSYTQTTKASRAATFAAERAHINVFTEAVTRIASIGKTGPLARFHKMPIVNSFLRVVIMAFYPRSNFRLFRGMAQQGVKSGLIMRQLGRVIFWAGLLGVMGATGITKAIFKAIMAGNGSWSDVAFVTGVFLGVAILCEAVPTALGLIIGSFDRRSGRISWDSNLPNTGHENFISRNAKNR